MSQTPSGPLTGKHVFAMLFLFFALILGANVALVWEAHRSFNGLSEENAYEKGIVYNEQIERKAHQIEEKWSSSVTYDPGEGRFLVVLSDRHGPASNLEASIDLVRPVHDGMDRSARLTPTTAPGTYTADLRPSAPGQWEIRIRAQKNGQDFETRSRIKIAG